MVGIFGRRTLGILELVILFLLVAAGSREIAGLSRGELLATTMKIESWTNATHYLWIERYMRNHLKSNQEIDSSFIHVMVGPKVNPRLAQAVLKACTETKSTIIWKNEKNATSHVCKSDETCSKVTQVVGLYEEVDDINPHTLKSSYGSAWNPRSKIVIWLGHSTNRNEFVDKQKFKEILASFWSINAVNVVFLVTSACESETNCSDGRNLRVFGYDPFVPRSEDSFKRGKLFERSFDDPLFPDKLNNLHGMPIRVSMYQQEPHSVLINHTKLGSGIAVNTLRYIAGFLNFTVNLISAPTSLTEYTTQLPDGQIVGPIGDILKNRSVYLANTESVQSTWGKKVEFLRPFGRAYVKVIVPRAGLMPGVFRIFRSVDATLAGLTFVNSLLLVAYFVARKKRYPWFNIFRLFMHQQIHNIGKRTSERIFLISWVIWAFVICTANQSQLIKDLAAPPFYKSIDKLEELAESPLTLMIEQVDIISLNNSESTIKKRLAERAIFEPSFARCVDVLMAHRNVACAIDSVYVTHAVKEINKKVARKKARKQIPSRYKSEFVHVAKEVLTEYWRTVIVQEGFPYLNKFNIAYDKMIEFGLNDRWWKDSSRQHFEKDPPANIHPKLSLNHFEGTFKLLMFGQSITFIVFLVEIIFYHVKKRLRASSCCPPRRRILSDACDRSRTTNRNLSARYIVYR